MKRSGLLYAAAFLSWASASAASVTLGGGAGVFQYYDDAFQTRSRLGLAAEFAARYERDESGYELECRYRRYGDDEAEAGLELRARYYFHPAPARPYAGPTAGLWLPRDDLRTYRVLGLGLRAGAVLTAAEGRVAVDVFGAYRGRLNSTEERFVPDFNSELVAGATLCWRLFGPLGVNVEGSLLWPGFFADKHGPLWGPGVAPFFIVGPEVYF